MPVVAFIGCLIGCLLSYQMPVYVARLMGQEPMLLYIWSIAWNDSYPTRILFFVLYMIVGTLIWVLPIGVVWAIFHPEIGYGFRRLIKMQFGFLWSLTAAPRLAVGRTIDNWNGELKARSKLRKLYHEDFQDQFISFAQFYRFYRWLDQNNQIDPRAPIGEGFAASADKFKDAEILLGLVGGYGPQDLSDRYKALTKQVHPDIAGPNDIMRRVTDARNIIKARKGWR